MHIFLSCMLSHMNVYFKHVKVAENTFFFLPVLTEAAGFALLPMRMIGQQSGCGPAAAGAPPNGCIRLVCSAGWMKSKEETALLELLVLSAMQNI